MVEIEKEYIPVFKKIVTLWMIGIPLLMLLLILDLVFPWIVLIIVICAFCGYLFPTLNLYDAFSNSNDIINKSEYFKIIKIGYGMVVSGFVIMLMILLIFQMFDMSKLAFLLMIFSGFCLVIIGAFNIYYFMDKLPKLIYYSKKQHPTKPNVFIKQFRYKIPIHESPKLKYIKNISANKLILISIGIVTIMAFILYMIIMHIIG